MVPFFRGAPADDGDISGDIIWKWAICRQGCRGWKSEVDGDAVHWSTAVPKKYFRSSTVYSGAAIAICCRFCSCHWQKWLLVAFGAPVVERKRRFWMKSVAVLGALLKLLKAGNVVLGRHSNVYGEWAGAWVPMRNGKSAGEGGVQCWYVRLVIKVVTLKQQSLVKYAVISWRIVAPSEASYRTVIRPCDFTEYYPNVCFSNFSVELFHFLFLRITKN